jgi:hypothetical protein
MFNNKYVIYHKDHRVLITDNQNNICIFNTKYKALKDCRTNEKIICIKHLHPYYKKQLEVQLSANKIASVSKALAKLLEIQKRKETFYIDNKFMDTYNRILNKYKSICQQYYY